MTANQPVGGVPSVLYLGDRSYSSFDFDGRVRRCTVTGEIHVTPRSQTPYLIVVTVDPVLPGNNGVVVDQVGIRSRTEVPISKVATLFPVDVDVFQLAGRLSASVAEVEVGKLQTMGWGVVAPLPEQLPMQPDRCHYEMLGLLYALQTKTGATDVPVDFRMNNQPLGRWIRQVRQQHRNAVHYPDKVDDLPGDWRDQLESFTDWTWELEQGLE